jgi:8-oxo-dGTP pyrophosphatase MutT (NUDIX family)
MTPFARAPLAFEVETFEARLRGLAAREAFVFPNDAVPNDFRRSSVLICFWRDRDDLRVVLTRRAARLSSHAGQMAFPGGRLDEGESAIEAALRETEEEIGLPSEEIEILGRLDDAWSGAGHLLVPVVGWLERRPSFRPNPAEVAEIHEPRVSALLEPRAYEEDVVELGDQRFTSAILRWPEAHVYGLSTGLLIEALAWGLGLEEPPGPGRLRALRAFLRHKAEADAQSGMQ